jgi:TetR/AcrR family transcriptional regulator, cholesterol catabolism regulator
MANQENGRRGQHGHADTAGTVQQRNGPVEHGSARDRRRPASDGTDGRGGSERRAALVQLAADMFAQHGFRATTVRDIAEAAGMLSGSLYHHFDSKESIMDELLRAYIDELLPEYRRLVKEGGPAREVLSQLVASAFASFERHRPAILVWQGEGLHLKEIPRFAYVTEAEAETERLWTQVIRRGIRSGEFRKGLDAKLAYRFIRDAVWMAARWYRPGGRLTVQQLAAQYLTIMLDGIDSMAATGERETALA